MTVHISAEIKGIEYTPLMCRELSVYSIDQISTALSRDTTFVLDMGRNIRLAVSWWVSPKRTRSYPYQRVYDSLDPSMKKVTVIPAVKDEGRRGDRDFLQWDTISLMSLLGIYVIISYYDDASLSPHFENKITKQTFSRSHLAGKMEEVLSYQSDALHWNLSQAESVGDVMTTALESYDQISRDLGVEMHSKKTAERKVKRIIKSREDFISVSRGLAKKAQMRESITTQPKERLTGVKGAITIKNYLGGYYYFTVDEVDINPPEILLIEGKHTRTSSLPSVSDIKDGLLKMILYSNLSSVAVGDFGLSPIPVLKLTTDPGFRMESLTRGKREMLETLINEAELNGFRVLLNSTFLV